MPDNEIKVVINADDKASNVIAGLTKTLKTAVDTVEAMTGKYMAYGDQVEDMSAFTRMSWEETSRMIQVGKQAEVNYSSLSVAMKGMVSNGVQPSIENMARLSDQFLSITDPLAQAQFLVDQFGQRAGPQMAKYMEIGGQAIRDNAAAVQSSLVLDQQKKEAMDATEKALLDFNNRMEGMRYDAAEKLLGIFQSMPGPIKDVTLGIGALTDAGLLNGLGNMAIILNNVGGLGPKLAGVGSSLAGVAASTWLVVGPVLAVGAAIASSALAVKMLIDFLSNLFSMFDKAAANGKFWEFFSKIFNFYELAANIDLGASFNLLGSYLPGRASGGPVLAGRAYMVGESGPEPFIPSVPGTILPSGSGLAAAGGNFQFVYAPMFSLGDRSEVEEKIRPMVLNIMRGR